MTPRPAPLIKMNKPISVQHRAGKTCALRGIPVGAAARAARHSYLSFVRAAPAPSRSAPARSARPASPHLTPPPRPAPPRPASLRPARHNLHSAWPGAY